MSNEELTKLFEGYGWHPLIVDGPTDGLDAELAGALDTAYGEIRELQETVRGGGKRPERPRWPMIVLKSPKGWTGPKEVDGIKVEGTSKAHQVPAMKAKSDPGHLKILEDWLRSYGPEDLFDENGGADPGDPRRVPDGRPADGREPARERRQAAQGPEAAGARQARARRVRAGPDDRQRADAARRVVRRRLPAQRGRGATSGSCARTRWRPTGSARCSRRPTTRGSGRSIPRSTPATRPTAGSWRCSPSTTARAGCRATCSPAATACSRATRRSSRSSTGWSTSTRSS